MCEPLSSETLSNRTSIRCSSGIRLVIRMINEPPHVAAKFGGLMVMADSHFYSFVVHSSGQKLRVHYLHGQNNFVAI